MSGRDGGPALVKRSVRELSAKPRPESPAELEVLSRWYFGAPLHFSRLSVWPHRDEVELASVDYRVREKYNDYHGDGWLFNCHCLRGYDYSLDFWRHVVGELFCGGIAAHSYGQARVRGRRNIARLTRFENCLRQKEPGRLRKTFVRLAREYGAGENTGTMDNGVLMAGRVDGAATAFIAAREAQP